MSNPPFRALRGLVGLAACALLAGSYLSPVLAQAPKTPDLLDQVKKKSEIEAQRVEAEVRDALVEAQRLAGSNPGAALDRLRRTLATLEADRSLTAARRDLLTRQIRDRIRTAEAEAARNTGKPAGPDKTREAEMRTAQVEQINRTLDQVAQLQKIGRTSEATKVAEDLFRQHPNLATPTAIGRTSTILDQVATLRSIRSEMEGKRIAAQTAIERSAMAPGSDVNFPKNWSQIMAMRDATNQSHLTSKDKEVLKSLASPISVDYDKVGFLEVIEHLSTQIKQPILLDKAALAEAGVGTETQVSLKIKGVSTRTVLRKVLGELGLAYIIKDRVIQVVSEKAARETMVTRSYFLGGLIAGGPFSDAGIRFVPGLNQFEALQNVISIINLIQNSVEPASWSANGGQGTITFHAPTMSLVIRNSAEVHGMVGGMYR